MARREITNSGYDDENRYKFVKPGDQLSGYYLGAETFDFQGKPITKHRFKNDDGVFATLGSAGLNKLLKEELRGQRVWVTYKELQRIKGGKTFKVFKVEADDADTITA